MCVQIVLDARLPCLDTLSNMCMHIYALSSIRKRVKSCFSPQRPVRVSYLRLVFWLSVATREPFGVGLEEKVRKAKVNERNGSFIGNSMMGAKDWLLNKGRRTEI